MNLRRPTAAQRAYDILRRRILNLDLAPSARVDEVWAAAEVGMSRTPVREALQRLAADELLQLVSSGGYVVADINLNRIHQLFEAQHVLVRAIARLLTVRAQSSDLDLLEVATQVVDDAIRSEDAESIAEANSRLHILEARIAGNDYLLSLAEVVYTHLQRLAFLSFGGTSRPDAVYSKRLQEHYAEVHSDHWSHLRAVKAGDAAAAETIAVQHMELFRSRMLDYLGSDLIDGIDFSDLPSPNRSR
ncbi:MULTISPECIES: GntR family transcriptional regulator [Brevibacterium]|uniref:GntR family transcriptional regulator n=1 Tax=Brevibacterium gallinarum TaxID=2762220 RepID=A0ABR8WSE6_9MICO|nr:MULTISPECIES: GntR family transcriptional regulator [Brevibacterium]MBD8019852.1 GntR family transcriptional regulator [Brevibacterium gallinarum]MBU8578176.1 FCD domain-containing protein [Brevibacterium luteolum]